MSERVLRYEEALAEVLRAANEVRLDLPFRPAADTPLLECVGRVLAKPIVADRNQPPFPRSTRDGFALIADDLLGGDELILRGSVRAGERWTGPALQAGEAIEIMTGAPVPEGGTAVLMVEHASLGTSGRLRPEPGRRLRSGENVVGTGAEARSGAPLVPAGRLLGSSEIALAASCGYSQLRVYEKPCTAIVATGDELVELGVEPQPWQIRNSNSYALAALVTDEGGRADRLPIARDTRDDLRERIATGRTADLMILSGGVSMGKYDLVEEALRGFGAEFVFTGARIQPGRPVVFGSLPDGASGRVWFFGLPGNPISTEVCFRLFVAPLLRALCGRSEVSARFTEARLSEDVPGGAKVTRFIPAAMTGNWRGVSVRPVPWQGSGDLAANARANCFIVLPLGVDSFHAGETVRVLLR